MTSLSVVLYSILYYIKIELKLKNNIKNIQTKMERKLNVKIEQYVTSFKDAICEKISETGTFNKEDIIEYIYKYDRLVLDKEDLVHRKRVKNVVPMFERCCSKRANDEQCSRRKKEGYDYCGTHLKGTPHGIVNITNGKIDEPTTQKLEVWPEDIDGIIYYFDKDNRVYQTEEIVKGIKKPNVIGTYTKELDKYILNLYNN